MEQPLDFERKFKISADFPFFFVFRFSDGLFFLIEKKKSKILSQNLTTFPSQCCKLTFCSFSF